MLQIKHVDFGTNIRLQNNVARTLHERQEITLYCDVSTTWEQRCRNVREYSYIATTLYGHKEIQLYCDVSTTLRQRCSNVRKYRYIATLEERCDNVVRTSGNTVILRRQHVATTLWYCRNVTLPFQRRHNVALWRNQSFIERCVKVV